MFLAEFLECQNKGFILDSPINKICSSIQNKELQNPNIAQYKKKQRNPKKEANQNQEIKSSCFGVTNIIAKKIQRQETSC